MPTLNLAARYVREIADPALPNREENFRYGHVDGEIPVEQAALVLVDCWAVHPVDSVTETSGKRCKRILKVSRVTSRKISP